MHENSTSKHSATGAQSRNKAWAAFAITILGAGVTAALGIIAPDTTLWQFLTVASAMLTVAATTFGVERVTNKPLD